VYHRIRDRNDKLRDLPAVHELLERLFPALARFPRALVLAEIRRALMNSGRKSSVRRRWARPSKRASKWPGGA